MITRRATLRSAFAVTALSATRPLVAMTNGLFRPGTLVWTFDNLKEMGGHKVIAAGEPRIVETEFGKAVQFDGMDDGLFIDDHPLAGTAQFTFEALFRPDGGAFEQRWLHLESIPPGSVPPEYVGSRMLFEVRVKNDRWWLDTFLMGDGYRHPLIDSAKTWPIGQWHHVAQTCDGTSYRAFVNGILQAEARLVFKPQGAGRASIGMRYTRNWPFRGLVRQAAFTRDTALPPRKFVLPIPGRQDVPLMPYNPTR